MGNFIFEETRLEGLFLVSSRIYGDERGYFREVFSQAEFREAGFDYNFIQGNQSGSTKGVLRGLHFQKEHPQAKLVRVISGAVYDVTVDLRHSSPSFGRWFGTMLSAENRKQLLIPRGFAHGFLVVSDYAEFSYLCDEFYHPEDEGGIIYNDPSLGVKWPFAGEPILSEKDKKLPTLAGSIIPF